MNDFEEKLKQYFPEIYALHLLSKDEKMGGGGEIHLWTVIESMLEMRRTNSTGRIYINYNKGRIDGIRDEIDRLAHAKAKITIDKEKDKPL